MVLYGTAIYCNHARIILYSMQIMLASLQYDHHTAIILHQLCKLSCFHAVRLLSCWNHATLQHDLNNYKPLSLVRFFHAAFMLQCSIYADFMLVSCCNTAYTEFIVESYCFHLEIIPPFFNMRAMLPHPFQLIL